MGVKAKANINLGSCGDDTKNFFKDIWNGLWYSSWDDWDTYFDTRSPILPFRINTTRMIMMMMMIILRNKKTLLFRIYFLFSHWFDNLLQVSFLNRLPMLKVPLILLHV